MKKILVFAASVLLAVSSLSSCKKESSNVIAKPVINLTEVGHKNSKVATIGKDMHLEGTIEAEGLIKEINVEIHKEGGKFEIEKSFKEGKYIGVKNTKFHEHIDIPANAPEGEYHLHFTVIDKQGQTATSEVHIKVTK